MRLVAIFKICEKSVEDGEKLLEEMDTEARSAPLQYRQSCQIC